MNGKLQGRIWDANLPRNHKFFLALLAWYADERGENIYPAMGTIARRLNLGERQVIRLMQQVQDKGYVQLVKRGGGPNRTNKYRIIEDALPVSVHEAGSTLTADCPLTFSKIGAPQKVTFPVATRDISGGTGDILRAIPDIQMSPKIATEHKTEIENTAVAVWKRVSAHLKAKALALKPQIDGGEPDPARVDTQRYRTYISTLHAVSTQGQMLILGVPHAPFAAMVDARCRISGSQQPESQCARWIPGPPPGTLRMRFGTCFVLSLPPQDSTCVIHESVWMQRA